MLQSDAAELFSFRWQCRLVTANILHEDQRHVYMIAIYMQLYLMAMAGAFKPKTTDFEVCTFSMEPYNFFNKDIEVRLDNM